MTSKIHKHTVATFKMNCKTIMADKPCIKMFAVLNSPQMLAYKTRVMNNLTLIVTIKAVKCIIIIAAQEIVYSSQIC